VRDADDSGSSVVSVLAGTTVVLAVAGGYLLVQRARRA